jgi:hypothetical protein
LNYFGENFKIDPNGIYRPANISYTHGSKGRKERKRKMSENQEAVRPLPNVEEACQAAIDLMKSDDAISSVEIEFLVNGVEFTGTYSGYLKNVKRK